MQKMPKILQIDVDAAEINKNIIVDVSVVGDVKEVLSRLLEEIPLGQSGMESKNSGYEGQSIHYDTTIHSLQVRTSFRSFMR